MDIEVDGATIHYERHGHGKALLWLHGFSGTGRDWTHQFTEVPDGFELIAPDLRGHGQSTNPSTEFSFRQAARDMLALTTALGIERLAGIGISGGGITLLHMALMNPALVEAAVLVSVPPYYPEQARAIQRQYSPEMLPPEELASMQQRHPGGPAQIDALFANVRAFADDRDDVFFPPRMLESVRSRTLLVYGDRDPLYPVSLGVELYAALPNAALWVVPDAGHAPVFGTHATSFREIALAFLR